MSDYIFGLSDTSQQNFLKDESLAGEGNFRQCLFHDSKRVRLESFICVRINTLNNFSKRLCTSLEDFRLDLIVCLGHNEPDHFGSFNSRDDTEVSQHGDDLVTGSPDDGPAMESDFNAFCSSATSLVLAA